uniref:Ankyrin repeat-containing protein ITN1 n=1 Tax=Elaeis guineensis var. tenera TaxID=51953 RepID=A0A8N4IH74_ELAGV|nr:ankyrin repeat-containing protein ITN1 [Elaeis guineensis]
MTKKKQTNTHAYQIMEELVDRLHKESHYGIDGMKPKMAQEESLLPMGVDEPKIVDEPSQPPSQQIQDKHEAEIPDKQVEDDSKQKTVGATPILVAAKRGAIEMVEKILEETPVAALDLDQDEKNIVLLAVENRQPRVYEFMLKRKLMQNTVFGAVDKDGNSALHLAARLSSSRPWVIPGAALQMQWEIKWYKYVLKSMGAEFFMQHNMKGETALEIFTTTHEPLVKDAGKWLNNTSQSCSVVAALIATVAFASATAVPGGVNQDSGFPIFEGKPAFQMFALSALIALCFSITSLVMFLSILTSRFQERDFEKDLPGKLIIGLTTLFMSICANLVSFCAGHFFVIEQKLKYAAYPIYAIVCLPVSFFAVAQFPLYIDLIKATFAVVPERTQKLHPF